MCAYIIIKLLSRLKPRKLSYYNKVDTGIPLFKIKKEKPVNDYYDLDLINKVLPSGVEKNYVNIKLIWVILTNLYNYSHNST